MQFYIMTQQPREQFPKQVLESFLDMDEQELLRNLSPAYLEWREVTLQAGRQEALLDAIRGLLEAKFGTVDSVLAQMVIPLMRLSSVERSRLILQSSREELLAWLSTQTLHPYTTEMSAVAHDLIEGVDLED
jgi:hypothetical protein